MSTPVSVGLHRDADADADAEHGVTRLDGLQLRDWMVACHVDLRVWADFVENTLAGLPVKAKVSDTPETTPSSAP